jgi:hypothetical protein
MGRSSASILEKKLKRWADILAYPPGKIFPVITHGPSFPKIIS